VVCALFVALAGGLLAGCTPHHGPLTDLGTVDLYAPARWSPNPATNQVQVGRGIYPLPSRHLILVHIQIPDNALSSLGPGATRGAVGVWWVALDDRLTGDGQLTWVPSCDLFRTHNGTAFDVVGDYLAGPAHANLSRYPLAFNPDDNSVSAALSAEDTIHITLSGTGGPKPYLPPTNTQCTAS
jgi:hypothetical protein